MKTVFKYDIDDGMSHTLYLPIDAKVVLFGRDSRKMRCMWVDLDTSAQRIPRKFRVYPTGSPIENMLDEHRGSFITPDGYVWHLYECC